MNIDGAFIIFNLDFEVDICTAAGQELRNYAQTLLLDIQNST